MGRSETLQVEVKLFADGTPPDPRAFVPLFHRVIRDQALPGLLIDVADYRHVHHGTAVLLVGHDGDYGWDLRDGRAGLFYRRKRGGSGEAPDQIREATRRALLAARHSASDPGIGVRFHLRALEFRVLDRLRASADPEPVARFHETLVTTFSTAIGELMTEPFGEPGAPLGLRLVAGTPPSVDALLGALGERSLS